MSRRAWVLPLTMAVAVALRLVWITVGSGRARFENVDTTAYNARRAEFADLLYQHEKRAGAVSSDAGTVLPAGVQVGLGVRTAAISMDNTRGSLRQTDGDLDLAIEGRGYFEVALPDGTAAYTRDGSFKRSPEGAIVTSDGYTVQPELVIPEFAD